MEHGVQIRIQTMMKHSCFVVIVRKKRLPLTSAMISLECSAVSISNIAIIIGYTGPGIIFFYLFAYRMTAYSHFLQVNKC